MALSSCGPRMTLLGPEAEPGPSIGTMRPSLDLQDLLHLQAPRSHLVAVKQHSGTWGQASMSPENVVILTHNQLGNG